ncbi:hypothetical protein R3W88_016764 [Solanum pinnatisectum]|uniref:Uncharacterized protein n=1 Tax=Solanum pinnatisectum TaxID=50273 RepID=A0AAV9KYN4_9SOLN|nr:hypothetical protein R3W88_016764 [Solanum pinnatisectum]
MPQGWGEGARATMPRGCRGGALEARGWGRWGLHSTALRGLEGGVGEGLRERHLSGERRFSGGCLEAGMWGVGGLGAWCLEVRGWMGRASGQGASRPGDGDASRSGVGGPRGEGCEGLRAWRFEAGVGGRGEGLAPRGHGGRGGGLRAQRLEVRRAGTSRQGVSRPWGRGPQGTEPRGRKLLNAQN